MIPGLAPVFGSDTILFYQVRTLQDTKHAHERWTSSGSGYITGCGKMLVETGDFEKQIEMQRPSKGLAEKLERTGPRLGKGATTVGKTGDNDDVDEAPSRRKRRPGML